MNGNGRAAKSDLVDRVLEGKDADTKARVLEFVYRTNIDPTDELFLFCIAIGYLETIVLTAPEQWEEIFRTFRNNLEQWKENHLKTLETSATFAEQLTVMTQSLTEQARYTDDIAKGLMHIHRQLETIEKRSAAWGVIAKSLTDKLEHNQQQQMTLLREEIRTLRNTITPSTVPTPAPNTSSGYRRQSGDFPTLYPTDGEIRPIPTTRTGTITTTAVKVLLLLLFLLTASNTWLLWRQKEVTGWLLYKANRWECRQGLVPELSVQCSGIK